MKRLCTIGALLFCQLSEAQITWSPPVPISDISMDAEDENLAVTPSGYAIIVYSTNNQVASATRPLGGNWSAPFYVPGTTATNTPKVGIDTNGNAVTVFKDNPQIIRGANLPFNGVWIPTMDLTLGLISVADPAVGISPTGNTVATWTAFIPGNNRIQSSTLFGFGNTTWTPATADVSISPNAAGDSHVAVDASSNAVALWVWNNGAVDIIQSSTLANGSNTWVPTTNLTSAQNASVPQVAVTPSGDAIAVWLRPDGFNNRIEAARLPFGSGVWINYASPLSTAGVNSSYPQVAIDPLGNAVVVWVEADGVDFRIRAASLPAAGTTVNLFPFLSDPGVNAGDPAVAIAPNGTAVATWSFYSASPTHGVVQASELPLGGNWSTPVALSNVTEELYESHVVIDGAGNPVVVWKIFNDTYQIQGASGLALNLLSGKAQSCNFGFLKGNSVFLSWDEGLADTAAFRIYRNGALIATLASNVHNYVDNIVKNNTIQNYILTSVNLSGVEVQIGMISVE